MYFFPYYFSKPKEFTQEEKDFLDVMEEKDIKGETLSFSEIRKLIVLFFFKWTNIYINNENQLYEPITFSVIWHILYHFYPWDPKLGTLMKYWTTF